MSIDLISAIEAREAEQPARESGKGKGDSEFPNVLRSSMEREDASEARAGREAASERESERAAESREQSARSEERSAANDSGPKEEGRGEARETNEKPEGGQEAEATEEPSAAQIADAAAAGGAASVLLERARTALGLEAEVEEDGRLTALDDESSDRGLQAVAEDPVIDGEVEAELAGDRAELAREVLEAARASAAEAGDVASADPEASAVATDAAVAAAAANREGESELRPAGEAIPTESALPAEVASGQQEDAGTARDETASDRQDPSQAAYDQALAGAQAEGLDPNLRQAIVNRDDASRAPETVAVAGAAAVANPVAGAVIETPTAVPGEPAPAPASDAISVQTEWLATRGGGTARLVLHPPELGELTIRVTLRGGNVDVVMVAQEAGAHSIAEEQSDRLAQAFASRDLRMDQFEVRRGDPNDFADMGFGQFDGSGTEREGQPEEESATRAGREGEAPRGLLGRRETGIGTPPQIVSVGPEASVDLRA